MDDEDLPSFVSGVRRGSVVAPAGYGKTEQVARTAELAGGRRLVLTHTHAGVDALKKRFRDLGYSSDKHNIETIAGWSLRYSTSFPKHSGIKHLEPRSENEWADVYESTSRLIQSGAVTEILRASYAGVFVDEYQDCNKYQHEIVKALRALLPVVVYGDPMQAIFDFRGGQPVQWPTDVEPVFPVVANLRVPWRWKKHGAQELADWLIIARSQLEGGQALDLLRTPSCVKWEQLPEDKHTAQARVTGICKGVLGAADGGTIVVIADPANSNARSTIAKNLSACGFSNLEPMSGRDLYRFAGDFGKERGVSLLECGLDFIAKCMTGAEKAEYLKAIESARNGGKIGAKKFGALRDVGVNVISSGSSESLLYLLDDFRRKEGVRVYRRELFYSMRSALRLVATRQCSSLEDAIYLVQTKIRHMGRLLPRRAIGSILLVKGLEFEHSVVVESKEMSARDWYVALTRASRSITVVSTSHTIRSS